jgi:hypothetical protein
MRALHLAGLLLAPAVQAEDARPRFPRPAAPAPDGGVVLDATRAAEARALVPPLLRYGRFSPEPGRWVEFDVEIPRAGRHVERLSVVGVTETARGPLYQVELDVRMQPHVEIFAWIVGGPSPEVDRVAVTLNGGDAVSVPVDLPLAHPLLRGTPAGTSPAPEGRAPFAGPTTAEAWDEPAPAGRVKARRSAAVPLVGLLMLEHEGTRWTARATGTGAAPSLRSVPLAIPRTGGGSPER